MQQVISNGLQVVRAQGASPEMEDKFLLVHLAQEVADLKSERNITHYQIEEPARLKRWLLDNADLFYATLADLDRYEFLDLINKPAAFGAYILMSLQAEMRYQQPNDSAPDHGVEDDMRERVRDYRLDEIGVC